MAAAECAGHKVFQFDDGAITFSSNFDNGNLARVERVGGKPFEFKIWTAPDNLGTSFQSKHNAWFHFVISGLPAGSTLRLTIVNASPHSGLYKHDMVSARLRVRLSLRLGRWHVSPPPPPPPHFPSAPCTGAAARTKSGAASRRVSA